MFPVLVAMYVRLAIREDREAAARFGKEYAAWRTQVPGWFPRLSRSVAGTVPSR